ATTADTLRFGVGTALPATVIIGKDGKVYKTISGVVTQADLRKDIEKLLQDAEKQAKIETEKQAKISDSQVSSVPS
ncbi:MAG: hypothetical protein M3R11_12110, partial [Acidobacteriota bacterium]|nr:hypothetical protein [Acidobacteriota bacterium]